MVDGKGFFEENYHQGNGEGRHTYWSIKGSFVWNENFVPSYEWFDGRMVYTTADTKMPPDEILALGVRMRAAHTEDRTLGALAAVVPDDKIELVSRVLGMLAAAKRPMRVFSTLAPAQEWLQRQPRV